MAQVISRPNLNPQFLLKSSLIKILNHCLLTSLWAWRGASTIQFHNNFSLTARWHIRRPSSPPLDCIGDILSHPALITKLKISVCSYWISLTSPTPALQIRFLVTSNNHPSSIIFTNQCRVGGMSPAENSNLLCNLNFDHSMSLSTPPPGTFSGGFSFV